jgi:hypothetical protein
MWIMTPRHGRQERRSAGDGPAAPPRLSLFRARFFPVLREFTGKNLVCAPHDIWQVIAIEAVFCRFPWSRNREKILGNREAKTLQQGKNRDDIGLSRPFVIIIANIILTIKF